MVRVTDSLLPQIAADFETTVGQAAIVVAAYSVAHGSVQLIIGPIADRFGKYRTIAVMCAAATVLVALCGMVTTLPELAIARFASGAAAGWIVPISMAYVGDVTPASRIQPVLARYLTGQIIGQLFGQAAGGVLGDWFGWRNVFFVLAGIFALATAGRAVRAAEQPAHPCRRAHRRAAALRRRLCRGAVESLGAVRDLRGVHRIERGVGRVRLCGRRPAAALRAELHGGRTDRRRLRHRRPDLCGLGAAAGEPARASPGSRRWAARCSPAPMSSWRRASPGGSPRSPPRRSGLASTRCTTRSRPMPPR